MRKIVTKLGRFKYTIHNVVAHPLSEICHLLGFTTWGNLIHDSTLPYEREKKEEKAQAQD